MGHQLISKYSQLSKILETNTEYIVHLDLDYLCGQQFIVYRITKNYHHTKPNGDHFLELHASYNITDDEFTLDHD